MLDILNLFKHASGAEKTAMLLRFDNGVPKDIANEGRVFESFGTNVRCVTNIKKFGTHSLYVGSSSRLQVPDSPELRMGSKDFTVEMFVYHASTVVNTCIFAKSNSNLRSSFLTYSDSGEKMAITSDTGIITSAPMTAIPIASWVHWALVRKNGVWFLFRNGTLFLTSTQHIGTFGENSSPFSIGGFSFNPTSSSNSNAYFDEIRVSNVARYTTNFTPSASRFVLD